MKSKRVFVRIVLLLNLTLMLFFGTICEAQLAGISIENVTVQLIQTRPPVGNKIIREYRITAVLRNTGDSESPQITVEFKEPEPGLNNSLILQPKNYSMQPNEEKTFVFTNWPTTLSGDIPINISFKPTSSDVIVTPYNSGYYIYTLHIENSNPKTSTPGFEVLLVFMAILTLMLRKKIKK